jgi:TatD DNase family protein
LLCDVHTHLSEFPADEIPLVVKRAQQAGVKAIISAGSSHRSSATGIVLAQQYAGVYAGVGIHPTELPAKLSKEDWDKMRRMATSPRVVCISETGLDFLPTSPPHELQCEAFRRQINIAIECKLPIVFHSREAHTHVLRILEEEKAHRVGGIMHYFQADLPIAKKATEQGFLVSFAKPLLRLPTLQEVARELPLDSIVLETDATPQPWKHHRQNWTEPWQVKLVAEKLAELKGVSFEKLAEATTANVRKLFMFSQSENT